MTIRQAAILVGGMGTRLGDITGTTPKPLLPCGDRPFLAWLLREIMRFGIEDVVLLAGYLAPALEAALPTLIATLPRHLRLLVAVEPVRAGTGGALYHARHLLEPRFLLMNGDSLFDCNLSRLLSDAAKSPDHAHVLLRSVADTDRYGVVSVTGDDVTAFSQNAAVPGPGLINAGVYVLNRDHLPLASVCSLEADILPRLVTAHRLRATAAQGYFIDIGVPDDLAHAQTEVPVRLHRPALFLDRDGTINVNHGWVGSRDRWEWVPGALDAIRMANEAGWHVFVVTNQSGIARGLYDEAALDALHAWMQEEVRAHGGTIDDIRFCPHHPDAVVERYRRTSSWRKPAPGMILDLIETWELNPARCVLVGDQPSDMEAAVAAGISARLFDGVNLAETVAPLLAG